jgi:hypothetical protein
MATIMEETVDQPKAKVSRSDRKRYEQSVFSGQCDEGVLFAARRIRAEWEADRRTFLARREACKTLAERVPELDERARQAARAAAEAEAFARSAIPDTVTIADLRARISAAGPKLRVGTPAELAAALAWLGDTSPSGYLGRLKSGALAARAAVADSVNRARQVLSQTAADHREPELSRLGGKIAEIESRIRSRQEVLAAESQAALVKVQCEQLARGERPPTFSSIIGQRQRPLAELYRAARAQLDHLCDLLARRPDAERDNARDLAELATLREKLAAAQQAALVRLAQPENMRWCE